MGDYPHQDFIYGIGVGEEKAQRIENNDAKYDVEAFCEENGLAYIFGGDATSSYGATGLVVGFELDKWKVVDEGYVGGYYVSKFDVEYFVKWLDEAKAKMTPDVVAKIQAFLRTKSKPTLWTISTFG